MIPSDYKVVLAVAPGAAVTGGAFAAAVVDCAGFRYAEYLVHFGAVGANPTALRLEESDAADMTGATPVPGSVVGTDPTDDGGPSVLTAAALANKTTKFEVDLRFRKRYQRVVAAAGAGATYLAAACHLKRGEQVPVTTAQKGCSQVLMCPRK